LRLALILTSQDRVKEVIDFIESLIVNCKQIPNNHSVELYFIAQDKEFSFIEAGNYFDFPSCLNLIYIQTNKTSLSVARNTALHEIYSNSELPNLIGYPDDDCVYPKNLLQKTIKWFSHRKVNSIGIGFDYPGCSACAGHYNRWGLLGKFISFSVFTITIRDLYFDENLGVGARFGACEETDYLFRLIGVNSWLELDKSSFIMHPDRTYSSPGRLVSYGRGFGYLARKMLGARDIRGFPIIVKLLFSPIVKLILGKKSISAAFEEQKARIQGFLGR
jgi:hypothetical protein